MAVRLSPESPVVQSSDVDEDESEQQRLKMHRRLHGVGTRDVGYEQVQNYLKKFGIRGFSINYSWILNCMSLNKHITCLYSSPLLSEVLLFARYFENLNPRE